MTFKTLLLLLIISTVSMHAAKVDTLAVPSAKMGITYKAAIALPDSYAKSKKSYPVVYLLHGAYGHFDDWLKKTPDQNAVKKLADQYNIIIVMPEGETFSFYLDSPVNQQSQFETYITSELIDKIDKTYRTINSAKGRAITGLSMGGHGALYLSTKHPELFSSAGSMSGAVDMGSMITPDSVETMKGLMTPVFGPNGASQQTYASYAVLNMIEKIKSNNLPIIIDIGVNDFLIEANRELHRRLLYAKIPHEYIERPGAHTWEYWQGALPFQILFFDNVFKMNGIVD